MEKVEVGDLIVITKACEWTKVGQIGEVIHVNKDGSGVDAKFAHDPNIPIETGAFDIFRKNGEEAPPSREQAILNASHALGDLLARKNADYGNSFAEQYGEYGLLSVIIRLDDKLRRLKTLAKSQEGAKVADEAIADTLLDMAGYALLASVEESDSEAV